MLMLAWVLIAGGMSSYGWIENPSSQYETAAACQQAGEEFKATIPGTWKLYGEGPDLPLSDFHCDAGHLEGYPSWENFRRGN